MEPKNEVAEVPEWMRSLAAEVYREQRKEWEQTALAAERTLDEDWLAKALALYNDRKNYKQVYLLMSRWLIQHAKEEPV